MGKRGPKLGEKYTSQAKILRVFMMARFLMSSPRKPEEMAERFNINIRTAYRYLNLINSVGFELEEDFHGRYFVINNPCQLCGKEHSARRAEQPGATKNEMNVHHSSLSPAFL